ncbi:MAG: endolytic transglycosylase MltG [Acidimicrobiales bacterium]
MARGSRMYDQDAEQDDTAPSSGPRPRGPRRVGSAGRRRAVKAESPRSSALSPDSDDERFNDGFADFAHDVEAIPAHQADDDGYEYEVIRPRRRRSRAGRCFRRGLLLLVVLVLVAAVVGVVWVQRRLDPPGPPGAEVAVAIPEGSTVAAIGEILEDEGIITDASLFRYYVRFRGGGPFLAGDFVLQESSSMQEAIDVLEAGPAPPPFVEFGVPEGLTLPEISDGIAEDVPTMSADVLTELIESGQIRSRHQPPEVSSLEGFLFPNTYRLDEGADEAAALQVMVDEFDALADRLALSAGYPPAGLTAYQVLTVASLIQEESRIPEDAPMIARVIYNRLAEGTPLGVDATICYLLEERPCELTQSDLEIDSPYNSRTRTGLPPTPIAAPGEAALEAALRPADGPWLYYVLDPDAEVEGGHFFTDDYQEFLAKKAECEAADLGCG